VLSFKNDLLNKVQQGKPAKTHREQLRSSGGNLYGGKKRTQWGQVGRRTLRLRGFEGRRFDAKAPSKYQGGVSDKYDRNMGKKNCGGQKNNHQEVPVEG